MRFHITAYYKGEYEEFILPALNNADYMLHLSQARFDLRREIMLRLEVLDGVWRALSGGAYRLETKQGAAAALPLYDGLVFSLKLDEIAVAFTVTGAAETLRVFRKWDISQAKRITVGKEQDCSIRYDFMGLVSKRHATLVREDDGWVLEDSSINGVFVNGQRVQARRALRFGDIITIFGLKLIYLGDVLGTDSFGRPTEYDGSVLREYRCPHTGQLSQPKPLPGSYKRAPRTVEELWSEPVEIEPPPPPNRTGRPPLLLTIGPAFTMILPMLLGSGMAILSTTALGGTASPFMFTGLVTAGSSAIIGVIWALVNVRYSKKQQKDEERLRFELYRDYLFKISDKLKEQYEQNAQILRARYPSAQECAEYGVEGTRLWNRNMRHSDFLYVRLGIGEMPFQVPVQIPKERFTLIDDSLADKPALIKQNFSMLHKVPVGVDLMNNRLIGVYGDGMEQSLRLARSIAIQIAANHCYTDVKMVFLYDQRYGSELSFARHLPHVWSEDKKMRYVATNKSEVGDVLYALGAVLRVRVETETHTGTMARPHYVVFVADPDLIEGEVAAKYLLQPEEPLGVSTVLLAPGYEALPNCCEYLVQFDAAFQGFYDVRTGDAGRKTVEFDAVSAGQAEKFARRICGIRVNEIEQGGELPAQLTFLDMYGVSSPAQLQVQDRWRKNRTYENMRALVGQKAGGGEIYLDIHEKYHGPHGLVAGTTGSGKSETLQTFLLSLAASFSPMDMAIFIIDFKGGGMANLFSDLPHMAGQISNLSGNQVRRAMVSIKSEIKRRQRIFGEYGVNHIDQYTRLVKSGDATASIPHLLVIIDEFAELKREEPDFMRELISVAQVGRSLGLHLILATQKPAGVVDDNIWSNSKFRLCLRVQDRSDSMEMLKRPDAAYIAQAGRGYLQVGNDEIFELFQSGWSGAVYDEDGANMKAETAVLLTGTGQPSLVGGKNKLKWKEQKRDRWLLLLTDCAIRTAKKLDIRLVDCLADGNACVAVAEGAIAELALQQTEYPPNSDQRMGELVGLLAELDVCGRLSASEAVLEPLHQAAARRGARLPELKEKTQLQAMVEHLKNQAALCGMNAQNALWLPVLPRELYLYELPGYTARRFSNGGWPQAPQEWALQAYIGLLDDPVNQTQVPLSVDFAQDGHVAVCGMVVSGKSTLLQTLLYSLVNRYSPADVNFYILDYSSRMLAGFEMLAHCGGVAFENQPDRAAKLFTMLFRELVRRKTLFGGGNYAQYLRANGSSEPAIILVIDGYASFREKTENRYEDTMVSLSREGAGYGMFLLLSGGNFGASEIPMRLAENVKTVFCLQLGDHFRYTELLRARVDVFPEANVAGRGVALVQGSSLEFQTAVCLSAEDDYQRAAQMEALFRQMNDAWKGKHVVPIPQIPVKPVWQEFIKHPEYRTLLETDDRLPLGYCEEDASLCSVSLRRTFTFIAAGRARSGKSNLLRCLMRAARDRGGHLSVVDASGELEALTAELEGRHARTNEQLCLLADELFEELKARNEEKRMLRVQGLGEEQIYAAMLKFPAEFLFIDSLSDFIQRLYGSDATMQNIVGFIENFLDKGALHNMYVFAVLPLEEYGMLAGRRAFELIAAKKMGVLLGGNAMEQRLFDFNSLPYAERSQYFKPGIALLPPSEENEQTLKIVLPLARG